MLCIKCNTDNKLKDRQINRGRCKSCRHEFAFDPKQMSGIDFTDKFFQQMLTKLSANDSLFFTSQQLYYFFNERKFRKKADVLKVGGWALLAAVVIVGITLIASGWSWLGVVFLILASPFAIAVLTSEKIRQKLRGVRPVPLNTTAVFVDGWFRRWCQVNGNVPKFLPPVKTETSSKTEQSKISAELKQYSFDRAVICESSEIARCLIANNFHFENNSAVLSVDGYPQDIFNTVMDMLRRNPELHVYALHDASRSGVSLPHILRTDARWFAGSTAKIFDLGLLPRQVMKRSVCVEKDATGANYIIPAEIMASLLPDEIDWLNAGNFVALESLPPQILLRIVTRGIAKSRAPQAADGVVGDVWVDSGPGIYYYGTESFG